MLADLVAEFAECPKEVEGGSKKLDEGSIGVASVQCLMPWELYVDRAANQRGSGMGLVLVSPERITIEKSLRLKDRKSTRLNSSHSEISRMPSSA